MMAITAVEYVNLRKFLNQIALLFFYWNCIPANIRLDEDVFRLRLQKTSSGRLDQDEYIYQLIHLQKTSSRCLQDLLTKTNIFVLVIRLQDVFKMFLRHLQDVLQKRLQYVFKTPSRRFEDVFKTSSRHLQNILQRHLQDVFKTYHQVKLFA